MKNIVITFVLIVFVLSCDTKIDNPTEYRKHKLPDREKIITKIAFSSGCKQYLDLSFFEDIKSLHPDLWIWGGDNIYSDTEDRFILRNNYRLLKQDKYYQDFISEIPVVGVWDDHDYGARDGGEEYPIKKESKEEFMTFFDISLDSDIRGHEGIYTSYEFGKDEEKVKIYMLDNRYFKSELKEDTLTDNWYIEDTLGTVLGEDQWIWLENEIDNSDAIINIFVSGIQIISNEHIFEKWGNFPKERKRFFELINNKKIRNPIVLSGDRHFAEFSEYYLTNGTKILEFTASGMTHSYTGVNEKNENRVGEVYDGMNFGIIEIKWGEVNKVKMSIYDIKGERISFVELVLD